MNARVTRGRATQRYVAAWFRDHGWPWATSKDGAAPGKDIDNLPHLSCEVKATSTDPLLGALRQAVRNATPGDLPFVIWRPNGYGPERIHDWIIAFRLADGTDLLRKAGYEGTTPA